MKDEPFLSAIHADPDDESLRLIYTDWLDEHGDDVGRARAELIRAQCELERLPAEERRRALQKRVRSLVKEHGKVWTEPMRKAKLGKDWRFRRGFPEEVTLSARVFVVVAEEVFRLAPTLRAIRFPDASNEVTRLAECPYLERLREVDLTYMCKCGGCPIQRELRDLFASAYTAKLTTLRLAQDRMTADGARRLAESPHLDRVTTLNLADNSLGTAGARALAEASHLASLTHLVLKGNGIGPHGGRALAASPHLAKLRTLDLSDNNLCDIGARALGNSPHAEGLSLLDLRNNRIGNAVARMLRKRFGKRVKL